MKLSDAPEFLTLEDLQDEIEEYTYRPGWELSVFADPWEGPCLYVKATVKNAYQKEPLEIRVRSLIPPIPDAKYFGHWLLWRLIQIENHEAREFLRYGGEPLFDPHDPIEPHPEEKTPKRQGLSPNHAIIGDSFNSLTEWQKSMSQRAQKTLRDLGKGLYGWDPSTVRHTAANYHVQADAVARESVLNDAGAADDNNSPLANMELMSDGSVKTIAKGTSPGNPFEDQDARTGESTSDDESTPDYRPQFEVRMFSDIEDTVSVWDRARSRWATEKTWNRLSSGARQEAERLNSALAPRFEVRDRDTGRQIGPAIWDTVTMIWVAPKDVNWGKVYPDRMFAERDAARLNAAPRVFREYGEIPDDMMQVEDVHGHPWVRARKGENRWTRLYPDGSSMGSISPYDHLMLPCIPAKEKES